MIFILLDFCYGVRQAMQWWMMKGALILDSWVAGRTSSPWKSNSPIFRNSLMEQVEEQDTRGTGWSSFTRIDWVKVLRSTRHKIGHFEMFFQPISWLSTKKWKQTQQKQTCTHNKIYYNIKLTQKLKPRLVASYDLRPGKGTGLFWKE